jgi:hypothetical protein
MIRLNNNELQVSSIKSWDFFTDFYGKKLHVIKIKLILEKSGIFPKK